MKKFFTLFAAAATAFSLSAADFELFFGDTPVTDGATYQTPWILEEENDEEVVIKRDSNLFFHGDIGTPYSVDVELLTSGASLLVCAGTQCQSLPLPNGSMKVTQTGTLTSKVQAAMIDKEEDFYDGDQPDFDEMSAKVKVTSGDYSATVTIKFLSYADGAGIKGIVDSMDFINVAANNTLNYSVSQPAMLSIYAITGNLVAKYPIANAGSINLNAFPRGLYIYTDGTHKGKIIVR